METVGRAGSPRSSQKMCKQSSPSGRLHGNRWMASIVPKYVQAVVTIGAITWKPLGGLDRPKKCASGRHHLGAITWKPLDGFDRPKKCASGRHHRGDYMETAGWPRSSQKMCKRSSPSGRLHGNRWVASIVPKNVQAVVTIGAITWKPLGCLDRPKRAVLHVKGRRAGLDLAAVYLKVAKKKLTRKHRLGGREIFKKSEELATYRTYYTDTHASDSILKQM